ncbi:MAG: SCO family protein [Lewinella sp.]|nr:SCO family protein [Lewinella sp.]
MFRLLVASLLLGLLLTAACQSGDNGPLPYYGFHEIDANTGDTIYHTIRDFAFIDQDSQVVTNETFAGKAYVADFFFISCPTICPKVKQQMLRIYDRYQDDDRLMLLSHTIDPKRDTVDRLKKYAQGLGADTPKWRFVTGVKDSIYEITYDYISTALEQPDAPGGFDHSGYILLIDPSRHLRAYANGTDPEDVDRLMEKIDKLLAEEMTPQ